MPVLRRKRNRIKIKELRATYSDSAERSLSLPFTSAGKPAHSPRKRFERAFCCLHPFTPSSGPYNGTQSFVPRTWSTYHSGSGLGTRTTNTNTRATHPHTTHQNPASNNERNESIHHPQSPAERTETNRTISSPRQRNEPRKRFIRQNPALQRLRSFATVQNVPRCVTTISSPSPAHHPQRGERAKRERVVQIFRKHSAANAFFGF